jgi:L-fuculose-phosphate aldolase
MKKAKEIVEVCKKLYLENYITATDGNVSVRQKDKIFITPKGISKENLSFDDLVVLDLNGRKVFGKREPSGEYRVHLLVYKERKDINAVIHTHPVFSTSLSVCGYSLLKPILPEVFLIVGEIPIVEYGTPYTEELPNKLKKYVKDYNAFILKNHGLLTIGKNLEIAFFRTQKVEYLAKIFFISKMFGKVDYLNKKQIDKLLKIRNFEGSKNEYTK